MLQVQEAWMQVEERSDPEWQQLTAIYREEKALLDKQGARVEWVKRQLIVAANGIAVSGFGVELSQVERKGSVQLERIPELQNVDIDSYRKSSTTHWRVVIQ